MLIYKSNNYGYYVYNDKMFMTLVTSLVTKPHCDTKKAHGIYGYKITIYIVYKHHELYLFSYHEPSCLAPRLGPRPRTPRKLRCLRRLQLNGHNQVRVGRLRDREWVKNSIDKGDHRLTCPFLYHLSIGGPILIHIRMNNYSCGPFHG